MNIETNTYKLVLNKEELLELRDSLIKLKQEHESAVNALGYGGYDLIAQEYPSFQKFLNILKILDDVDGLPF